METNISKWLRIFLGLFLIAYALNQFLHIIPAGYTDMPDNARDFLDAVVIYLPLLYVFEIITGLFLIFNKWTALILIVLFPLSVSFLIFTFANQDLSETWPAVIVAGLNVTLLISSRKRYKPLFE
jgi:putative oxidoreductase